MDSEENAGQRLSRWCRNAAEARSHGAGVEEVANLLDGLGADAQHILYVLSDAGFSAQEAESWMRASRRWQRYFDALDQTALALSAGIETLRPLMEAHGFRYEPEDVGVSSGGSFSNGWFRRGRLAIGLIVRHPAELGCPNYTFGEGYAGHEDLFWALGRDGDARLDSGAVGSYRAKDGTDPFDALHADLEEVVLPALDRSESDFEDAVRRAHRRRMSWLLGESDG